MSEEKKGICYLVGAGPGDPGLLTLRGRECIAAADVLVYDYLCAPALLQHARPDAEKIYAGKKAKDHTLSQDEINALIVEKCLEGKTVTRLKGGDPFVFGRGGEEAQVLKAAGVLFEIIPGVSSALAGPAYAGIPVTHRSCNSQLTLFTGHEDPDKTESSINYKQLCDAPGMKVMLMGMGRLPVVTREMLAAGASPDLPVALVRWATTGRQQTLTGELATIAGLAEKAGFKAPAVAVFGETVKLREELDWFESRPLFGRRIVVTRTRRQASGLSDRLQRLGADVLEIPTIRIEPPKDKMEFAELVRDAHTYDWLVFTSPNGVDRFFEYFFKIYEDVRSIGGVRIAAIGPGTAKKINANRLAVDLLPEKYVAEGLLEALTSTDGSVENLKLLWVRAEETRDVLRKGLIKAGAILDEAIAYRTVPETTDPTGSVERFRREGADVITFTSSSTVDCFRALDLPWPDNLKVASIGPVTSDTVRENGWKVDVEAEAHDIPGLTEAVLQLAKTL